MLAAMASILHPKRRATSPPLKHLYFLYHHQSKRRHGSLPPLTQKHALLGDLGFYRERLSGIGRPKQSISAKCQGKYAGPRLLFSKPVCSPSSPYRHRKHDSLSAAKIKPKAHSNFLLVESCAWFVSIKPGFCGITWPIYRASTSKRVEPRVTQERHFVSYSVSRATHCCWRPLNQKALIISLPLSSGAAAPSHSETLRSPTSAMQPSTCQPQNHIFLFICFFFSN